MVKFTTPDFMSTATSSTMTTAIARPKRPTRILVPTSRKLRLPIAPPSPFYDGMNEDINTEPFPDFQDVVDLNPIEKEEPLHCVLHCHDTICKRMVGARRRIPPCRCAFEKANQELATPSSRPEIHLDDSIMETLLDISAHADPDKSLDIHLADTRKMLHHLHKHVEARALRNKELQGALKYTYPGNSKPAVLSVADYFLDGMRLYFNRTLRESGHRILTVRELRSELDVYVWTMLRDWMWETCDDRTIDESSPPDPRLTAQAADSGAPGAVSGLWKECVDDVVGLMVWRDEEARRYKSNLSTALFVLGCVGVYIISGTVSHFLS